MSNAITIRHGYKYRLRTQPKHEAVLRQFIGCCRYVWNKALNEQNRRHAGGEKFASYVDMAKWLTAWRAEHAFLKAAPVHALQSTLKDLEESFKRFFKKSGGRPDFKRYGENMSFSEPDRACFAVDEINHRVRLPKIGWIRYRNSRDLNGQVRNLTVSYGALGWHVALQTELIQAATLPIATAMDAGDRGVTNFLAQANGTITAPLNAHKNMLHKLKRYQRACARKVEAQKKALGITGALTRGTKLPVSNRLHDARQRLARMQAKIARERANFLHQLSTNLANTHAIFVLEDLKVRNMSASAAGASDKPGRNVKQKSGLNRSILDQGWSAFRTMLTYKLQERGGAVLSVPPQYTSQKCNCCGYTDSKNRRGETFVCLTCGHTDHADINAAKNILAAGHAVLAGRDSSKVDVEDTGQLARPVKRKPSKDLRYA